MVTLITTDRNKWTVQNWRMLQLNTEREQKNKNKNKNAGTTQLGPGECNNTKRKEQR